MSLFDASKKAMLVAMAAAFVSFHCNFICSYSGAATATAAAVDVVFVAVLHF